MIARTIRILNYTISRLVLICLRIFLPFFGIELYLPVCI